MVEKRGKDYMRALGKRGGRPTWEETLCAEQPCGDARKRSHVAEQRESQPEVNSEREERRARPLRLALWGEVT